MNRLLPAALALLLTWPLLIHAEAATPSTRPTFTAEQQQWLEEHRQLRVGLLMQAPWARYDQRQQKLSGANVELINLLLENMGVEPQWRRFSTRAELNAAAQRGELDLVPGMQQTPAGLRRWLYSDPYMRVPHLLVGERLAGAVVDLDLLGPTELLAVRAPSPAEAYLHSTYSQLRLLPVTSARSALQQVLQQKASYAVVDEARLSLLLREPQFSGLSIVGDLGLPRLLRIASRRDQPLLAEIIERALRAMPAGEVDRLRERWLPLKRPQVGDSLAFWRSLTLLLLIALLGAAISLLHLHRQRRSLEHQLLDSRHQLAVREVAEQALRLSQFSIDHSTVGILWVNWDSHVRYANHAAETMLGYAPGSLVERPLRDLEASLDMDRWLSLWKQARSRGDEPLGFETECLCADGSLLPVDVSLSFLRFRESEYLVVFLTDVTERRRTSAALQESEARFKGIAGNVPGLVFRLERAVANQPVVFAYISTASLELVGYPAEQLQRADRGLQSLVHPEDLPGYMRSQQSALASDSDWYWQGRILTRDGQLRWADIRATARRLDEGRVLWDGIVWDITANKQVELELAESRSQLRELSKHLESVREEEKARIAREVHDELGQVLTVLKLETAMCELACAGQVPGLDERLQSMKRLIAQLFQLVRDVATALRPPILDAGIASAIEWQVRRFEARSQIPCLVEVPEHLPKLSDAKAVGLFRILQEALTNVMRHAEAHSVEVMLRLEDGELCLHISDDGKGFATDAGKPGQSFGLVGMQERILMLGGSLTIDSQPGQGTTLLARVALTEEELA
ncbi:PAS domain-containing sensor histidine kinase [Pseudomonas sp. MBLB4136]|uniref:PAS domain-containing sensor histidine kinase n=1 Tax=Pseudomonas sp. MBLB4136 TaxID=3451558 RepID=UPI003F750577